ncbi:MAG TPA: hypothetical protein DIT07_01345 [Sphingobacteriaceae bacterium]|nr:hypothetical protein [Sphingobacteriaceae bacterium]
MTHINDSILETLAYFDVFNYPLTKGEIFLFLHKKYDHFTLESGLQNLVLNKKIYRFNNFYTLINDPTLIKRREKGNDKAAHMLKIAKKISHILIKFPYVRGIAVSGSLSKNFADEKSDIDLFIITATDRLWIARTIMHLFKKLTFLVNKQHFFCMNYYIDEQQLEIVEKNIYTATEVVTLIPMEGDTVFENFFAANNWTRNYLPNNILRLSSARQVKNSWFKMGIEFIFNNKIGNAIDNKLKEITQKRWQKKTQQEKQNMHGVIMSMEANKHFSKPDPSKYQNKLLTRYEDKVFRLLHEYETSSAV